LFLITVSLQNFSLSILLIILLTPIVIYALNCSPQQPLWQRLFCFVLLNPITMAMLIFIVANNQPLLGCTRSPLLLDCLYSYCSQKLSSFAAGIVENHFAHSSRLLFVLTVPAFGIYLDSAQLLFSKLIN
jgi:hypothetical protein